MKYLVTLLLIINSVIVQAQVVSHDKEYFTSQVRNTELIYTKDNKRFAESTAALERKLQASYESMYGYVMDERLYVGLISSHNQIANGFSTQFPNNIQINYLGGTQGIDYFCSTSWLDTLLYHETAHNYQFNAKDNLVSKSLHTVFGNGGLFLPSFTVPNIAIHPFISEGNAVLNESWHGNGGRLYSGRFKAQNLLQVRAGYINPSRMHNKTLYFPYAEHSYTMGAFFQYYLAKEYGLEKTNSVFMRNSQDWYWPFFTNNVMQDVFGIDFEQSLKTYARSLKKKASSLVMAKGEIIAHSQNFTSLNSSQEEIFFLTNECLRQAPELLRFDKKKKNLSKVRQSYLAGKVIRVNDKFYTQASEYTSPWRIHQGLFDENSFILDESRSKMVQGSLSSGELVYFDVASSYDQAQLYIGEVFYGQVNSSVFIDDKDNIYYFKQDKKQRTLYKNREALYSYEGYYGIVSDVDSQGRVYFVANSELGSSLYRYNVGKVERSLEADNIIEARLINDEEVLVAATSADDYYYTICALDSIKQTPYVTELFFEDKKYYDSVRSDLNVSVPLALENKYFSFLNMNYSSTLANFGIDSEAGTLYTANINFQDPLRQNALSFFAQRDLNEVGIGGLNYKNTQYFLNYQIEAFGVYETDGSVLSDKKYRDGGINARVNIALLKAGYYTFDFDLSYLQDYENFSREPISSSLTLQRLEQFGLSKYANSRYLTQVYGVQDRGNLSYGARLEIEHELGNEFYAGANIQYSKADFNANPINLEGIKVSASKFTQMYDPSSITMASIKTTGYTASAIKTGVSLKKVFNFSQYFFTFPFSLQRESLYADYNYYDFKNVYASEMKLGIDFDLLLLNTLLVPLKLEYIYNDNEKIAHKDSVKVIFGLVF